MKYISLIVLLIAASFGLLQAAISDNYNAPVASNVAYSAITGTSAGVSGDDYLSAALNIGFNFNYCGTTYTQVKMDTNGYIGLGTALSSSNLSNDMATTSVIPIIAAIWDDLLSGNMVYTTLGTMPNRIFVAQWTNTCWNYTATAGQNFQIRLYETSDKIDICFGAMIVPSSATASIGINYGAGGSANFYSITPGSPMTYSTTVANNAISDITYLTTGTTYTFNKVVASVPPNPAVVVSPANSATLVATTATLNWSSGGGIPTGYKLYFGTNTPPTNIVNGTNLGNVTTYDPTPDMAYGTTYYWKVVPYNANGDATGCPIWSFATGPDPVISTFPYLQNCDSATFPPYGWQSEIGSGATGWQYSTSSIYPTMTPYAGAGMLYYNSYNLAAGSYASLISPPINATGTSYMYSVGFWMYRDSSAYPTNADRVEVYVNSTPSLTGATLVGTVNRYYTLAPAVAAAGWYQYTFDIGAGTGTRDTKYAILKAASEYGNNMTIDEISITRFNMASPPNPAVITSPTNTATGVMLSASLNWSSGGGAPTGYKIYFGTNNPPTNIANGTNLGLVTTYDPTPDMAFNTPYYWKVVPYNGAGDATGCPVWSFTTGGPVINMNNGSTTLNVGDLYSFYDSGGPAGTYQASEDYTYTFYAPTGYRIVANFLSFVTEANYELLSVYNGPFATDPLLGSYTGTATLPAFVSTHPSGAMTFVFHSDGSIQYAGWEATIQLGAQPSGVPGYVTLLTPADGATGVDPLNVVLTWAPDILSGGIPNRYQIFVGADPIDPGNEYYGEYYYEATSPSLNLSAQTDINIGYSNTWYWAILPENGDGTADPVNPAFMIWDFTTFADPSITSLPHSQYFDGVAAPVLPNGWHKIINSTSTPTITTTTSTPNTAPNNVMFYNAVDASATVILATPHITVGITNIKLSFWARWYNYSSNIVVGTMTDPANAATFTQFTSITPTSVDAQYIVSFATYAGTDQYIAFKMTSASTYAYLYLDTVNMEQLMANDIAATAISGLGIGVANTPMTYNVSVFNNGTAAQPSYRVHLKNFGGSRLQTVMVNTSLAPGATVVIPVTWTPITPGTYNLCGEADLTGDGNSTNNETAPMAMHIYSASAFIPKVGDINSTTTSYQLPINMFYRNSLNETIYLPQEMQVTNGTIQAVIYQNNFTQDLTKEIKIWMKNTTTANVATAWLDSSDYTLVADVMVHFPLGVNAVTIPLDTPFVYTGQNLAVRTYRVWESVYWNSSNLFYYTADADNPNRDRFAYYDGTGPIDPIALLTFPADGGAAIAGYVSSNIPNTAFIIDPATPVTTLPAPTMTGSTIGTTTGTLTWAAVPGAYAYRVYESLDPYNWPTTPVATVHTTSYTGTIVPFMFYRVTAITTYRNMEVGFVLNPAAAIGFDNSKVKADPALGNTNKKD